MLRDKSGLIVERTRARVPTMTTNTYLTFLCFPLSLFASPHPIRVSPPLSFSLFLLLLVSHLTPSDSFSSFSDHFFSPSPLSSLHSEASALPSSVSPHFTRNCDSCPFRGNQPPSKLGVETPEKSDSKGIEIETN